MASITITNIIFSPVPSGNQLVSVYYRLATDPDITASYTLVTNSQLVLPNGELSPSLVIDSLDEGTDYVIKVLPKCGSGEVFTYFRTPPPPDLTCSFDCCSWDITNGTTEAGDVYYNTEAGLEIVSIAAGETVTIQGTGIISLSPGFVLSPAVDCASTTTTTSSTTTTTTISPCVEHIFHYTPESEMGDPWQVVGVDCDGNEVFIEGSVGVDFLPDPICSDPGNVYPEFGPMYVEYGDNCGNKTTTTTTTATS